ncbi:hypothetical protein [Halocola ammonii]
MQKILAMRVVGDIPDELMKITLFKWNEKYLIKFEIGQFEQVYKINSGEVAGIEELKKIVTPEFKDSILGRFVQMRTDFAETFQKNINS